MSENILPHLWSLSPAEAEHIQRELASRLILEWDGRAVRTVGGVDVSFPLAEVARCAIAVLRYPDLKLVDQAIAEVPVTFPYIPGLLAFREGPAVLAAWERLTLQPDLLMFDGQGIAHPRQMGIAAHMGLWLDRPSIGVAKSRLYGRYRPPGLRAGDSSPLWDEHLEQVIGAVVRTRAGANPIFISPGHRIDLEHALHFVLACARGYRLPEPTRWAHRLAGQKNSSPFQPRLSIS
ncbi:MAG: deoxyribonuclease V [Anaerolineales bacterium]